MTTYTLEREDTGEYLDAYQIRDEIDRLDGAAADGMFLPEVPERTPRLPRREHHDVPARDYAELIGQTTFTPDRAAIRDVWLHMRVGYEHLRQQAQDWEDLAFTAEQLQTESGPQHRDVTTALMQAYEAERDALIRGLPAAVPLPEQHPAHQLAPERLDADAAQRRKTLAQAAQGERRELAAVELSEEEKAEKVREVRAAFARINAEPDGWVPATWWARTLAWIGSRRKRGV